MSFIGTSARTFALETSAGRLLFGSGQLVVAWSTRNPYRRASALLRAWRATENVGIGKIASEYLKSALTRNGQLVTLAENPLLRSFLTTPEAQQSREHFGRLDLSDCVRMRLPRPLEGVERQGNLILLKSPDDRTGEKGVILLKYSESFRSFASLFEVERLVSKYMIVLEPSWWGYKDAAFYILAGSDSDVLVQSPSQPDHDFLSEHGFGLESVRIGAGDWGDPALFRPSGAARRYDVVMVSSWNPFKRHRDLFAALKEAKSRFGRTITAALIGYPSGWTFENIRAELQRFGIADQCEIFDSISQSKVAEIVSQSRLYVLLSRREGANKAMYEALFCDTPVLVPRAHRGVNLEHLNLQTGATFAEGQLTQSLLEVLDRSEAFSPRTWALSHTGFENATRELNNALKRRAVKRGQRWEHPILAKKNQPNLLYAREQDRLTMEPQYDRLIEYLRSDVRG